MGIGTTNPVAKFEIVNPDTASNIFGFIVNQQDPGQGIAQFQSNGTTTHQFGYSNGGATSDGNLHIYSDGIQTIRLDTAGNSYFTGGNVGIGTTNPQRKLQITDSSEIQLRLGTSATTY